MDSAYWLKRVGIPYRPFLRRPLFALFFLTDVIRTDVKEGRNKMRAGLKMKEKLSCGVIMAAIKMADKVFVSQGEIKSLWF